MSQNYDALGKPDGYTDYTGRGQGCFGAIFYNMEQYRGVRVFILKNYNLCKNAAALRSYRGDFYSVEEMKQYISLLNDLGMGVTWKGEVDISGLEGYCYNRYTTNKCCPTIREKGAWEVYIDMNKLTSFGGKFSISAIRYLYQEYYDSNEISKAFLKLAADDSSDLSLYNRFVMSHYVTDAVHNEHVPRPYDKIMAFLTEDQRKAMMAQKQTRRLCMGIPVHQSRIPADQMVKALALSQLPNSKGVVALTEAKWNKFLVDHKLDKTEVISEMERTEANKAPGQWD